MWKIRSNKVTVYKKPSMRSEPLIVLHNGDVIDLVTRLIKGVEEHESIRWIKIWLSDGRKGYIPESTLMENIGNGEGKCSPEAYKDFSVLIRKRRKKAWIVTAICFALFLCLCFSQSLYSAIQNAAIENHKNEIAQIATKLQDGDRNVRISAIDSLVEIGDDYAAAALVAALMDEDEEVQERAIDAFTAIGYDNSNVALSNALNDENALCRKNAVAAFAQVGSDYVAGTLVGHLDDSDEGVRQSIRATLEGFDYEATVKALNDAATNKDGKYNNTYDSVRKASIEMLGQIGGNEAAEALVDAFDDKDQYIRDWAVAAIVQIGYDNSAEALIVALHDENSIVRKYAAESFGTLGDARPVQELITTAVQDDSLEVRVSAINSLGEIREGTAVESLIVSLGDMDDSIRSAAATALGKIGEKSATESLINALQDEEINVRICAINALGKIGDERAVEPLITIFENFNDETKDAAVSALANIGGDQAKEELTPEMERLLAVLIGGDEKVSRDDAAQSLSYYGTLAITPLVDILDTLQGEARYYGLATLNCTEKMS
ncbi:MAG: HEAT repeat domain-containing protein [Clostridiaceae bacterium]